MISMCSDEHNSKDVHNDGTSRSSSNDLMRPGHPFVFSSRRSVVSPPGTMSHCTSHCTCSYVSLKKNENEDDRTPIFRRTRKHGKDHSMKH